MKKILFPFYNSTRHSSLVNKPWFRTVIVLYLSVIILWIPLTWFSEVSDVNNKCLSFLLEYNTQGNYYYSVEGGMSESEAFNHCGEITKKAWLYPGILAQAVYFPIILYFVVQFLFFKIIIDFIVLADKASQKKGS